MTRAWNELLSEDHTTIEKVFAAVEENLRRPEGPAPGFIAETVEFLRDYVEGCHNQKEEKHLFPLIQERGVPAEGGPLGVMLDEHRRQSAHMEKIKTHGSAFAAGDAAALAPFKKAFTEYAMLCKDHYWKENDILYPMAARVMSAEDARAVQDGILAVEAALGPDTHARYYALADKLVTGVVQDLSLGLDREVLACILNMLPVELSFVDADDTVQYFSHEDHDKIFPRNRSAIGTKVQDCHPPTSVHLVNKILREFKAGSRQVAEFWIEMGPRFVHIRYFPVRDKNGAYLGTLEVVQDAAPIRALEGQRRILAEE